MATMSRYKGASRVREVRRLRLEQGLTQRELASLIGVTPACVSQWEHAVCGPWPRNLPRVADALGVSVAELAGNHE